MKEYLKQYFFVVHQLTAREIKRKYARSFLGIIWSVLNPLLFMVVMSFVFSGKISNGMNFPVYFITGHTFWAMFSTATNTSMTAFEDNRMLFNKTKLPRSIIVLSRDYTALVNLGFSLIAMAFVLIYYKIHVNWTILIILVDIVLELLFSIGISFILATVYVFYKDIMFIWTNICVLLVHMIGLFITIDRYPVSIQGITRNNPMFIYPDIARNIVLYGAYDLLQIKKAILWSLCSVILGWTFFKIKENDMVKKI